MISQLVKGCVCLRLAGLPSSVSVAALSSTTGRAAQRATYYHRYPRRQFAFGWAGGDSSRPATTAAQAVAGQQQDQVLRELKDVPDSLMETVEAVASDVDGTLTTPEVTVTSRTKDAIKAVLDSGLVFFPATGKVSVVFLRPPFAFSNDGKVVMGRRNAS